MTFFYYEIPTKRFIICTNIKAISEFAGIPYHKIYGWFNNDNTGPMAYVEENQFICARSELIRGKQRLPKQEATEVPDQKGLIKEKVPRKVPDEFNDFFNKVGEKDNQ